MKAGLLIAIAVLLAAGFVASTQVTFFIIPPIGAVPEGQTLLISRFNQTQFIDSPDAMCERMQGGVNLLCRGLMMGAVAEGATILLRLPYSDTLYTISTGGKHYDR